MSLLDIDDVEGAIAETARALRPGGVFSFAIVHPFDSACGSNAAGAVPFAVSRPYLASRRYEDRFEKDGLTITLASTPVSDWRLRCAPLDARYLPSSTSSPNRAAAVWAAVKGQSARPRPARPGMAPGQVRGALIRMRWAAFRRAGCAAG